jgi:uncharacterized repeat protein (TIGR01451 family)
MKLSAIIKTLGITLFVLGITNIKAQTTVDIVYADHYQGSNCPLPLGGYCYATCATTGYNDVTDNMTVQILWGDGTDTTFIADLYDAGGTIDSVAIPQIHHNYYLQGNYSPVITVTGPDNNSDSYTTNGLFYYAGCTTLSGYTYDDINNNCIYDAGDVVLAYKYVIVEDPAGNVIGGDISNASGYFSLDVPTGLTGLFIYAYGNGMSTTCPVSGGYSFNSAGNALFNFGLECNSSNADYYINHTGMCGYGPPGGNGVMSFTAGVNGCTGGLATITLTLDPLVTYVGMVYGPAPTSVVGSVLTWNTTLTPYTGIGTGFNVSLTTATSTSAVVMSPSCFDLNITGPLTDPTTNNNSEHTCLLIGGPYDPNNKEVMPAGVGVTGKVAPNTEFNYLVNFQNTGTAPAINIFVIDTIDIDLDMTTFEVTGSSHAMDFTFSAGNIVRFDFPNINLIDSNANEPLSHGWVTYRIKAKSGLANGTTIHNTAYIYFDYNAPIVTNTTLNTIDISMNVEEYSSVDNNIYPNPATDAVNISFNEPINGPVQVLDVTGRVVYEAFVKNTNMLTIKVAGWKTGVYEINVTGTQLTKQRFVVAR